MYLIYTYMKEQVLGVGSMPSMIMGDKFTPQEWGDVAINSLKNGVQLRPGDRIVGYSTNAWGDKIPIIQSGPRSPFENLVPLPDSKDYTPYDPRNFRTLPYTREDAKRGAVYLF